MAQRSKLNISTILLAGIIVLVGLAGWFGWNTSQGGTTSSTKASAYQAVFLANGQVYFGKLSGSGQFMTLQNVFYLQAGNNLQTGSATDIAAVDAAANDLTLVKLGKELHGPSDKMVINRDQVLFWESLSADSKVVSAIASYKQK